MSQRFLGVFFFQTSFCFFSIFVVSILFLSYAVKSRTLNREPMTPNIVLDLFVTFFRSVCLCFKRFKRRWRRRRIRKKTVNFKVDSDYELVLTSNECDYHWSDLLCVREADRERQRDSERERYTMKNFNDACTVMRCWPRKWSKYTFLFENSVFIQTDIYSKWKFNAMNWKTKNGHLTMSENAMRFLSCHFFVNVCVCSFCGRCQSSSSINLARFHRSGMYALSVNGVLIYFVRTLFR